MGKHASRHAGWNEEPEGFDWSTSMHAAFAFSPFDVEPTARESARDRFVPVFAIHEGPEEYEIEADVPGASAADIRVETHGRDVIVHCEHVRDGREEGAFTRRFRLSRGIDGARLATELCDGTLHVRIPKAS